MNSGIQVLFAHLTMTNLIQELCSNARPDHTTKEGSICWLGFLLSLSVSKESIFGQTIALPPVLHLLSFFSC